MLRYVSPVIIAMLTTTAAWTQTDPYGYQSYIQQPEQVDQQFPVEETQEIKIEAPYTMEQQVVEQGYEEIPQQQMPQELTQEAFPESYLPEDFLSPLQQGNNPYTVPVMPENVGAPKHAFEQNHPNTQPNAIDPATFGFKGQPIAVENMPTAPAQGQPTWQPFTNQPIVAPTQPQVPQTSQDFSFMEAMQQKPAVTIPKVEQKQAATDFWKGADPDAVLNSLNRIVEGVGNNRSTIQYPLINKMVLNILQTDVIPAGLSDAEWAAQRANLLLKMGHAASAYNLVRTLQSQDLLQSDTLAQQWTLLTLLAGDTAQGCGFVRQQMLNTDGLFWRQALMVCQTIQGEMQALKLSLQLLDSAGMQGTDDYLVKLLRAVLEDGSVPIRIEGSPVTTLQAILLGSYPGLIQPDMLKQLPDVLLKRIIQTQQLSITLRAQAAEQLTQLNPSADNGFLLAELYDSFEFDLLSAKDPIGTAEKESEGVIARGLLWQASSMGSLASLRAQSLQAYWQRAQADGLPGLQLTALPGQRNLQPMPQLAWVAPKVIPIAIQSDDVMEAQSWYRTLQRNRTISNALQQDKDDMLLPLTLLTQPEGVDAVTLGQWWGQLNQSQKLPANTRTVLTVLDALGTKIPLQYWQTVFERAEDTLSASQQPDHIWLRLLAFQLNQKQTGAALLMVLEPLANQNLQQVGAQTLANALTALNYLGYKHESRLLAALALMPQQPQPKPALKEKTAEPTVKEEAEPTPTETPQNAPATPAS